MATSGLGSCLTEYLQVDLANSLLGHFMYQCSKQNEFERKKRGHAIDMKDGALQVKIHQKKTSKMVLERFIKLSIHRVTFHQAVI